VAQNGRLPGLDEVSLHFECVGSEIARLTVTSELWVVTGNES